MGDSMAGTNQIRNNAVVSVCLFIGLFFILVLACGGQAGNSNPQLEQKEAESGIKHTGQTETWQPQGQRQPYAPDEVLVKFEPGTDAGTIERIRTALNLETIRKFSSPNLFLLKITDGSSVEAVIEQLKTYEAVKYAEPNYVVKATQ
jgi:hypothetical protein